MQSCVWAKSNQGDSTHHAFDALPDHMPTSAAACGCRVFNNHLIFAAFCAGSTATAERIYAPSYITHFCRSASKDSSVPEEELICDLHWEGVHTGNGTFSLGHN